MASTNFTITALDISTATVKGVGENYDYQGSKIEPQDIEVSMPDVSFQDKDCTVSYGDSTHDNTNAGTDKSIVTITGESPNCTGATSVTFTINQVQNVLTAPDATTHEYNGGEQNLFDDSGAQSAAATFGAVEYALVEQHQTEPPSSGWTTEMPKRQDAGTYHVWCRAAADTSGNYTASAAKEVECTITQKELTVTPVVKTKVYDATATAELDVEKTDIKGTAGTEKFTLNTGAFETVAFESAAAGKDKKVTLTPKADVDLLIPTESTGAIYSNYNVKMATEITGEITPKTATFAGIAAKDKTYDGNKDAKLDVSKASIGGVIGDDAPTIDDEVSTGVFEDANVGTNKTVTFDASKIKLTGKGADNYTLNLEGSQKTTTATITAAPLTVKADAKSKVKGEKDPVLTYSVDGLKGSDKKEDVLTGTLSRAAGEDVGSYDIQQGSLKSQDANYEIGTFVSAKFDITPQKGVVSYGAHVQDKGDIAPVTQGMSGTTGESKRLEAIQMKISGASADGNHVWYRVHSENYGTLGWAKDGAYAGTAGYTKRAEAVEVVILPKGAAAPGSTANAYRSK